MVVAQHPASAGQGVLVQVPGPLIVTQDGQIGGEVAGRDQRVGVVVAQHPPPTGQGVLDEVPGPLVATQPAQVEGKIVG